VRILYGAKHGRDPAGDRVRREIARVDRPEQSRIGEQGSESGRSHDRVRHFGAFLVAVARVNAPGEHIGRAREPECVDRTAGGGECRAARFEPDGHFERERNDEAGSAIAAVEGDLAVERAPDRIPVGGAVPV